LKIHPHDRLTFDYGTVIARVRENLRYRARELDRERTEAPALLQELTAYEAGHRERPLGSPRFHTWGLFELLIGRSGELGIGNPALAEELALLALQVSNHLDLSYYSAELTENLRARAWSAVGNARRVRSDLQGSEEAFHCAASHLKAGTREPVEKAVFLDLKASLRRDQRRFHEAIHLLDRAVHIFLRQGERHRAGRSLVNLSIVHNQTGNPQKSISLLQEALGLIDAGQEPRLLLCARHNLIFYLADAERYLEAHRLYSETRPFYRIFPDAWTQNRRKWVRGKIARGLQQLETAESLFRAARDGFMAEGGPYDTALVSLELAVLYAEQGRTAELRQLAEEMVPIFASRQIHREALAALAFFRQAAAAEHANLEMITRVSSYLRRAQDDPAQHFEEMA